MTSFGQVCLQQLCVLSRPVDNERDAQLPARWIDSNAGLPVLHGRAPETAVNIEQARERSSFHPAIEEEQLPAYIAKELHGRGTNLAMTSLASTQTQDFPIRGDDAMWEYHLTALADSAGRRSRRDIDIAWRYSLRYVG